MSRRVANELWRATCRAAKVEGLNFDDLRGELASSMAEAGVPIHEAREALGHSSITMTNAYLRSRPTSLDGAYERLERARVFAFEKRPIAGLSERAARAPSAPRMSAQAGVAELADAQDLKSQPETKKMQFISILSGSFCIWSTFVVDFCNALAPRLIAKRNAPAYGFFSDNGVMCCTAVGSIFETVQT